MSNKTASKPPPAHSVLRHLASQKLHVPDLWPYFNTWPKGVNCHYSDLIAATEAQLRSLPLSPHKLSSLLSADFALFASTWWPRAAWSQLVILAELSIWLFVWDDEIDMAPATFAWDFAAAQRFREETVNWVYGCVEELEGMGGKGGMRQPPNAIIRSFKTIGEVVKVRCDYDHRQRFLHEMKLFLEQSQVEQVYRLKGEVPSLREYWACRMGTSAVGPCIAMAEFSKGICLPSHIMQDEDMKIVWDETNIIISIVNDIFSLKKEISTGFIISLVPLTAAASSCPTPPHPSNPYLHPLSLTAPSTFTAEDSSPTPLSAQAALDLSLIALSTSVKRFEEVAERLIVKARIEALDGDVAGFIDVCRENVTGNLYWSLRTKRYGVEVEKDGSVIIAL